jgi:hypothetical protein
VRKIYQNTQEIAEDWLRKIKIYKIKKFDSIFPTDEGPIDKEKFNLRNVIQNWMFKDSIENFQGLIEFIEGLVTRKK